MTEQNPNNPAVERGLTGHPIAPLISHEMQDETAAELRKLAERVPMPWPDAHLITADEVAKRVRLPVIVVHRLVRDRLLPQPAPGTGGRRWVSGDVRQWLAVVNHLRKVGASVDRSDNTKISHEMWAAESRDSEVKNGD